MDEIAPLAPEAADLVTDHNPSPSPRRSSVTSPRVTTLEKRHLPLPPHSRPPPLEVAASPLGGHSPLGTELAAMELRMQTSTGEWKNIPVRARLRLPLAPCSVA